MFHLAPGPAPRTRFGFRPIHAVLFVFAVVLAFVTAPKDALASCDPLSNSDLFLDPATIPAGEIGVHFTEDSLNSAGSMSFPVSPSTIVGIKIAPSQMDDSTETAKPNVDYFACLDPVTGANNVTFLKAGPYIVRIVRASGPDEWHIVGVGTVGLGACFVMGVPVEFKFPIPPKAYVGTDACAPAYFPVQGCEASLRDLVADVKADAAVAGGPVDMVFVDHGGEGNFTVNQVDNVSQDPADVMNREVFSSLRTKVKSLNLIACSTAHGVAGEDFIQKLSVRLGGIPVTGYTGKIFTWVLGGVRKWSCAGVPFTRTIVTAIGDEPAPTVSNRLAGNYPNPFNPETVIRFTSAWTGPAEMRIFDLAGRLVQTLAKSVTRGPNEIRWNGTASTGGSCASGIYFVTMKYPDGTESGNSLKITVVR